MDINADSTRGGHPQVPPAKPPDRSDGQQNGENPAHVQNEAMSEDEATTTATMEEQPMTAVAPENGVSPVIMSTNDPGGDHVGTAAGGPEVIPQNHVGARNHGPGETIPNPTPFQGATGTENLGPGDDAPPPYPGNEPGRSLNPRNPNLVKVTKGHFDRSMNTLIDATRDLAQDQHRDNLKLEANVGIALQISQDLMQYLNEFQENMKGSHRILHEKMATMCSKIASMETAVENTANAALERGETTNVKTLITEMAEEVKNQGRTLVECTKVSEKIEGLLRENQSPMVRQDKKRVRVQSPTQEAMIEERMIHEGASNAQTANQQTPVPAPQTIPTRMGPPVSAPQRAAPPGTVISNGSLATTIIASNGNQVLRKPGPAFSGPTANPSAGTSRLLSNGSRVNTYIGDDGRETLRLPRPQQQGQNRNTSGPGARPKQDSYAARAATPAAPTQTRPGPNPENQRNSRGANQGQLSHGGNTDKQPNRVKDDHYEICPDTGNFIRVEAYKTVPYKSEKQKGQENKRHQRNLAQVMCELVLFGIPTKTRRGDIMTSAQDRLYIAKFLRELRKYGYNPTNGDVVGNVRQWRNTRHPDHIPITITFRDEETRLRVEEAALEGGLKGHRTPREGDEQYGRIGFIRRSLTERERKELKIKKEKRNSPAGIAFAEIKRREENSRADNEDWVEFDIEGDEDPIIDLGYVTDEMADHGMADHPDLPANEAENNNNNNPARGEAMSKEAMISKMEEMQRSLDAMNAEKEQKERAEAEAIRAAEEILLKENEAADSDIEFRDPITGMSSRLSNRRGSLATSLFGTPRASPSVNTNVFATEPVFNFTGNLNLDRPNLASREVTHTDTPKGGDSSDSECEFD